jgi:protein-disulfide isomerase
VKFKRHILLFVCLSVLVSVSFGHAAVEWDIKKTLKLKGPPLDMAASKKGKWIFILTGPGEIAIYSSDGNLEDTISVGPQVRRISAGPEENQLLLSDGKEPEVKLISIDFIQEINITGAPVRGNADAPVTIVVFSEFQCPYCARLQPLLKQVLEQNKKTVRLAFKHFPLKMHAFALSSAEAAEVAAKNGKFWEFHDRLFQEQAQLRIEKILNIAVELGFDRIEFEKQLKDPTVLNRIQADIGDGEQADVQGVPTVFINGRQLKKRNLDGFQEMIDQELEKRALHPKVVTP